MNANKKTEGSLEALFDALADSVLDASDADIVEEFRAEGESPQLAAGEVRALLGGALKRHRQRRLEEARAARQRSLSTLESARPRIPPTAAARRELFFGILQRPALELQFRDFKEMTDDDIESWLEQFASLGLLDDGEEGKR